MTAPGTRVPKVGGNERGGFSQPPDVFLCSPLGKGGVRKKSFSLLLPRPLPPPSLLSFLPPFLPPFLPFFQQSFIGHYLRQALF